MRGRGVRWCGSRGETRSSSAAGPRRRWRSSAAGIPFEIVPGVTAGVGVTAYAGIPVTHRAAASAVAFVTGHGDPESDPGQSRLDWPALARFPGTLVVYMGVTHLAAICRTLLKLGKPGDTPAAVIESGTLAWQRTEVGTLATIAEVASQRSVQPPALLVVGSVVALRDELDWFERLPLFGQRIVVTRPRDEGSRAAVALEALGAEVLLAPTVEVRPISDPARSMPRSTASRATTGSSSPRPTACGSSWSGSPTRDATCGPWDT